MTLRHKFDESESKCSRISGQSKRNSLLHTKQRTSSVFVIKGIPPFKPKLLSQELLRKFYKVLRTRSTICQNFVHVP